MIRLWYITGAEPEFEVLWGTNTSRRISIEVWKGSWVQAEVLITIKILRVCAP